MNQFNGNMRVGRCRPVALDSSSRSSAAVPPSHDEIAKLAYFYWEARGRQGGSAVEDWLRAERALRERSSAPGIR